MYIYNYSRGLNPTKRKLLPVFQAVNGFSKMEIQPGMCGNISLSSKHL